MRRLAALALCAASATPAASADLTVIPRAPAIVIGDPQLCLLGAPVDVYSAPATASNGRLPAGLMVVIVETPFDPVSDLWVRLRAPRGGEYYGYVATANLSCV